MKPLRFIFLIFSLWIFSCENQVVKYEPNFQPQYKSFFTGNKNDKIGSPKGGICLMGGSRENDNAMRWFLNQADGGDILVLRASGSNGYNDYMYSNLGVDINSVESIIVNNRYASIDPYIRDRIERAEGIWFAGGNQWNYVNYWKGTPVDSLIQDAVENRNIVIGGTSAGMAILGKFIFSAEKGTISSQQALANPFDERITIDSLDYLNLQHLDNVITDTHYSQRDRQGRHLAMLARLIKDKGVNVKGVAIDERTSICINKDGIASVYGENKAFFIKPVSTPESMINGSPLNWNHDSTAVNVYCIEGTTNGSRNFNLIDWEKGSGGYWENWYIVNGVFYSKASS